MKAFLALLLKFIFIILTLNDLWSLEITDSHAITGKNARDYQDWNTQTLLQEIQNTKAQLRKLPNRPSGPVGGTFGYASETFLFSSETDQQKWVGLQFQTPQHAEVLVIVPALHFFHDFTLADYGFPKHFRIESSLTGDFSDARTHFDTKQYPEYTQGFPLPRGLPVIIPLIQKHPFLALRLIATTHHPMTQEPHRAFYGLSELYLFQQNHNIARNQKVIHKDYLTNRDNLRWLPEYLIDGQSSLGQPRVGRTYSTGFRIPAQKNSQTNIFVDIDLGKNATIDKINLLPSYPRNNFMALSSFDFGFPRKFKIISSLDSNFTTYDIHYKTESPIESLGQNIFSIAFAPTLARYIRLHVSEIPYHEEDGNYRLALAEMQILHQGNLLSQNTEVSSNAPKFGNSNQNKKMHPALLVDGLSNSGTLSPLRPWLEQLNQRRILQIQLETLTTTHFQKTQTQTKRLKTILYTSILALMAAIIAILIIRAQRNRNIQHIRNQIADDLHDDIGSNLGSISLMSETLLKSSDHHSHQSHAQQNTLQEISDISKESYSNMRDIVWMLGHKDQHQDYLARLRETAQQILHGLDHQINLDLVAEDLTHHNFNLEQKKHLLLFLKEALHNIRKHAQAQKAKVILAKTGGHITLKIQDDGCGFCPETKPPYKLQTRAKRLNAQLKIESSPSSNGTHITLDIPTT